MKDKLTLSHLVLVLLLASITNANAQWVQVNGTYGGPIYCFATVGTYLFAGTANGVLLSTDKGSSWNTVNSGGANSFAVIGTNLFAEIPNGIFLSTDSGKSWTEDTAGMGEQQFADLAIIGTNLFVGTSRGGVFISTDGGASWSVVCNGLPFLTGSHYRSQILALATIGTNLFAGTGDNGVFLSTNSGANWSTVNNGLPKVPIDIEISNLAVSGTNLLAEISSNSGLYLTTDSGKNWTLENTLPYLSSFAGSDSNLFAIAAALGVYFSSNNGVSWSTVNKSGLYSNLGVALLTSITVSGNNVFLGTNGAGIWRRPLSELVNTIQAADDTLKVFISDTGTTNLTLSGDSSGYRTFRINFINKSNITLVVDSASLTTSNNRFILTQLLPGVPDTLHPNDTFSIIIHFSGDTSGTVYLDTIVLKIGDPTSFYIYLTGKSFTSPKADISQNSQSSFVDFTAYPNPLSQSTTIRFTSPESGVAHVTVVNLLGEEVARVFEGALSVGEHSFIWSTPPGLFDGMYECVLEMNGRVQRVPLIVNR